MMGAANTIHNYNNCLVFVGKLLILLVGVDFGGNGKWGRYGFGYGALYIGIATESPGIQTSTQAAGFGCRRTGLPAIVILNLKELVHPWHIDT